MEDAEGAPFEEKEEEEAPPIVAVEEQEQEAPLLMAVDTALPTPAAAAVPSAKKLASGAGGGVHELGIEPPEEWSDPEDLTMPPEAAHWTRFERDLFIQSEGVYHPGKMAQRRRLQNLAASFGVEGGTGCTQEVRGRVSIVTPTTCSRQVYHEQLWGCFEAQSWPDKELIVVETYEAFPSAFLRKKAEEDSRLVLVSFKCDPDDDFNVGLKRDMTLHLASGEFVVNFDDDDIYAASYTERMVGELETRGLQAITLSAWYNYFTHTNVCGYSDPQSWGPVPKQELDEILYGYGFSYVHRRRMALIFPYPNVDFAEDAPFLLKLRAVLGDEKVALKADKEGICMHMMHRANSTGDPEFSRRLTQPELVDLEVAGLALFQHYLESQSNSCWLWRPLQDVRHSMWRWAVAPSTRRGGGYRKTCL